MGPGPGPGPQVQGWVRVWVRVLNWVHDDHQIMANSPIYGKFLKLWQIPDAMDPDPRTWTHLNRVRVRKISVELYLVVDPDPDPDLLLGPGEFQEGAGPGPGPGPRLEWLAGPGPGRVRTCPDLTLFTYPGRGPGTPPWYQLPVQPTRSQLFYSDPAKNNILSKPTQSVNLLLGLAIRRYYTDRDASYSTGGTYVHKVQYYCSYSSTDIPKAR